MSHTMIYALLFAFVMTALIARSCQAFQHPDKLNNFRVYGDGEIFLGVVDVTLPNLTPMKETNKGSGLGGEVETPAIGHFGSMKLQMTWRQATAAAAKFTRPDRPRPLALELKGAAQTVNSLTHTYRMVPIKIVVRGTASDFQLGKFDPGVVMGTTSEIECTYFRYEYDDELVHEIDKYNFKSVVGGVDVLAEVKAILGD